MVKVTKLVLYVFAAWFLWVSWRGVPYFSQGFEEGLQYYREEISGLLNDFAEAGVRVSRAMQSRLESLGYSNDRLSVQKPSGRFTRLDG